MIKTILTLIAAYFGFTYIIENFVGAHGLLENAFVTYPVLKLVIYGLVMAHLTITMMSLSFHRFHTHKGVIINKAVDRFMQIWLWLVTSMSKLDWVSIHIYHHAHSDQEKDPHSPVQKGFWRVFTLGVFDYTKAKSEPQVIKIRKALKADRLERFFAKNLMLGPVILTVTLITLFGPKWGSILSVINFSISPLFAVGGVNALAHTLGYKNHVTTDNSRNIGFLFPLNFIICGELDHNNHHAHAKSCSFRHRWYEFDIGYVYLKVLSYFKLASIKYAYTTQTLKEDLAKQVKLLIEKETKLKEKAQQMAEEFNLSYQEFLARVEAYIEGKKIELELPMKEFVQEMKFIIKQKTAGRLSYAF